jgi:hypothetical protein
MNNKKYIEEITQGHYRVMFDFMELHELIDLFSLDYRYVWGGEHREDFVGWSPYNHTLFGDLSDGAKCLVRNMCMEFLIETKYFIEMVPNIKQSVMLVHTNSMPPYYITFDKIRGKGGFKLLADQIDYHFFLDVPGSTDYGFIVSRDIGFLEGLITKPDYKIVVSDQI